MKIGYSYFGRCRGVQYINGGALQQKFPTSEYIDLDPYRIELKPNNRLLRITKEEGGLYIVSLYSFAREMGSDRGGSFIGASLAFIDCIAPADLILACTNNMLEYLITIFLDKNSRFTSVINGKELKEPHLFDNVKNYAEKISKVNSIKNVSGFIEFNEFEEFTYGINMIHYAFKSSELFELSDLYGSTNKKVLVSKDFKFSKFDLNYKNQIQESNLKLTAILQRANAKEQELELFKDTLSEKNLEKNKLLDTVKELVEKEKNIKNQIGNKDIELKELEKKVEENTQKLNIALSKVEKNQTKLNKVENLENQEVVLNKKIEAHDERVIEFEREKKNLQNQKIESEELKNIHTKEQKNKSKNEKIENEPNTNWELLYIDQNKNYNNLLQRFNKISNEIEKKSQESPSPKNPKIISFIKIAFLLLPLIFFALGFGLSKATTGNGESSKKILSENSNLKEKIKNNENTINTLNKRIKEIQNLTPNKFSPITKQTGNNIFENESERLTEYEKLLNKISKKNNVYDEPEFEDFHDFINNPADTDLKRRGKQIYFNFGNTKKPLANFKIVSVRVTSSTIYEFTESYLKKKKSNFDDVGGWQNYKKSIEALNPKVLPDASILKPGIEIKIFYPTK